MTLVVALDAFDKLGKAEALVDDVCGVVDGFKVGLPFVLRFGADAAGSLKRRCNQALWIADYKLADIGYVMRLVASEAAWWADAVIAHAFVGAEGALDELKSDLEARGQRLVLVVSMSHPGSREVYDRALPYVLSVAERLRPWGVVAPATRPEVAALAKQRLPWAKVLAPGVGAQGASPGDALCAGADYEIVGRLVTGASEPRAAALEVKRLQEERMKTCGSRS